MEPGDACVEGVLEECNARWLVCSRGLPERLGGEALARFRMLKPGSLTNAVSEDLTRVYYVYVDEGGAGLYIEADIDAPDRPECAARLHEEVVGWGRRLLHGLPGWRAVEFILSNMVFRAGWR